MEIRKYYLALENLKSDNGPDLKVYLSETAKVTSFIKLGGLKSTNGNQLYKIQDPPDLQNIPMPYYIENVTTVCMEGLYYKNNILVFSFCKIIIC